MLIDPNHRAALQGNNVGAFQALTGNQRIKVRSNLVPYMNGQKTSRTGRTLSGVVEVLGKVLDWLDGAGREVVEECYQDIRNIYGPGMFC